jgi:hypothetical protein
MKRTDALAARKRPTRTKSVASLSTPASISSRTQSVWPFIAAIISAVHPSCTTIQFQTRRKPYEHGRRNFERRNETNGCPSSNEATDSHQVFCLLVGPGIDEQPHTVRVALLSGNDQRCPSDLRNKTVPNSKKNLMHMVSGISKRRIETNGCPCSNELTDSHLGFGLLVGPGVDQQPHTVRVAIIRSHNQCCPSELRNETITNTVT